ncbi:MAG TPA: hypothetical protein VF623_16125 [Segetibacter sp.]|jgi:hypothetical protein
MKTKQVVKKSLLSIAAMPSFSFFSMPVSSALTQSLYRNFPGIAHTLRNSKKNIEWYKIVLQ